MILPDDATMDANLLSYRLNLPDSSGSITRFFYESAKLQQGSNAMVFKNCVGKEQLERTTYVAIKPINIASSHDDDGIHVYKAARISTSFKKSDFSIISQTTVQQNFVTLKVSGDNQESILKLKEQVGRSMAVRDGQLLRVWTSFTDKQSGKFCAVIFSSPLGSLRTIMKNRFPRGFPEDLIQIALRKILKPLRFLHTQDILHRDINAGHVYLFDRTDESFSKMPRISLGFAATAAVYDGDEEDEDDGKMENSAPYLPMAFMSKWAAAPEVYNNKNQFYTEKADIWLVGITALELAYGGLKVANRKVLEALINEILDKKKLPGKTWVNSEIIIDEEITKKAVTSMTRDESKWGYYWNLIGMTSSECPFSETFTNMVMQCLAWDPKKRPNVDELMSHKFLKESNSQQKGEKYFYDGVMKKTSMKKR